MYLLIYDVYLAVLMTEGTMFISEVVVQRKNLKKLDTTQNYQRKHEFTICELQIQGSYKVYSS